MKRASSGLVSSVAAAMQMSVLWPPFKVFPSWKSCKTRSGSPVSRRPSPMEITILSQGYLYLHVVTQQSQLPHPPACTDLIIEITPPSTWLPTSNIADIAEIFLKLNVSVDNSDFLPFYKDGPLSIRHSIVNSTTRQSSPICNQPLHIAVTFEPTMGFQNLRD